MSTREPAIRSMPDARHGRTVRSALATPEVSDLASAFKALGDPIRLRLLLMIAAHPDGEACVCELTPAFAVSAPTISHHLKTLREAGLVTCDRRGTWIFYRPVEAALNQLADVLRRGGNGHGNGHGYRHPGGRRACPSPAGR